MIDNAVVFGLGKLASGLPAFVQCTAQTTAETLTGDLVEMLPPQSTVLEIVDLEIADGAEPSSAMVAACRSLRGAGYRLALHNFIWHRGIEPLVEAAAYIKVDFSVSSTLDRQILLNRLHGTTAALVAERVETQDQFHQAHDEGFDLVQGYYFCRPEMLENRKIPANRFSQLEILRLLRDESVSLHKLSQLVKRDASLTYRLLRLVNSPLFAVQQEIHSVQAALLAVGEDTFRRMATIAIASDMNSGQPSELLRMAFVRGRFCELAARYCRLDCTEQYLLGLMSLLPAMLRVQMSELVSLLPLRPEIRRALLGEKIPERRLLVWVEAYEMGEWTICDSVAESLGLGASSIMGCYQEAIVWTESALFSA
jgi:EAL and modified HD-GYP domain-containing signal transduction protein